MPADTDTYTDYNTTVGIEGPCGWCGTQSRAVEVHPGRWQGDAATARLQADVHVALSVHMQQGRATLQRKGTVAGSRRKIH
jgi:hypothetical protein